MNFVENDGGREAAGYKGHTGDCVCRAIAIATGLGYEEVYAALNAGIKARRRRPRGRPQSSRTGVGRAVYENEVIYGQAEDAEATEK